MDDFHSSNPNDPLEIMTSLLARISEQIDMFYEPEDYHALDADFAAILPGIAMLQKHGIEPPDVALHVMRRYLEQKRSHG